MFGFTRYPMKSKTESGRVGYRKKYRVAGRVWVPPGHWIWAMTKPCSCTLYNFSKKVNFTLCLPRLPLAIGGHVNVLEQQEQAPLLDKYFKLRCVFAFVKWETGVYKLVWTQNERANFQVMWSVSICFEVTTRLLSNDTTYAKYFKGHKLLFCWWHMIQNPVLQSLPQLH